MANLINHKIRIRDFLAHNKRSRLRQFVRRQMLIQRFEEVIPGPFLVLWVRLLLVRVEEGNDEQRTPVSSEIAHGVGPVLLLLRLAVIGTELARKATEHGVGLREDFALELDDGDRGVGVQLANRGLFVLGVFIEGVADVFVGYTGVLPEQPHDLSSASRLEVEVVDRWHASDLLVCSTCGTDFLGGGHGGVSVVV